MRFPCLSNGVCEGVCLLAFAEANAITVTQRSCLAGLATLFHRGDEVID